MIRNRVLAAIPYPGVVVALCLGATIAVSTFRQGVGLLFPFIQDDLEISRAQMGLIASGVFVGTAPTSLIGGWLADVVGVRQLQALTMGALCAGLLLFSQVQSLIQGFVLMILLGVVLSASFPVTVKGIVDWVTPRTRGRAVGSVEVVIPIGVIISAFLLPLLAETYNWRVAVMVVAIIIGAWGVVFFAFYKNRRHSYTEGREGSKPPGRISMVARDRDIWLATLFGSALSSMYLVLITYLVVFLKEDLGLAPVVAGRSLAVAMVGSLVGRFVWGAVSDLLLQGRRVGLLAFVSTLSVVSVASLAWLPADASMPVVWGVIFVMGITAMGWTGLWTVLISELAGPGLTGTALGFVHTIVNVFVFGAVPLFGFIVDRTESYDVAWGAVAGLAAFGTLLLAFLRREGPGSVRVAYDGDPKGAAAHDS